MQPVTIGDATAAKLTDSGQPSETGPALGSFAGVELGALQELMKRTYGERDAARGQAATVAWIAEEVGELAQAVRKGTPAQQLHELGDVLAWLASLAEQLGLSLEEAVARYADGCPRCGGIPCRCP
jgi:NTP pyrophosphatase (non-canonical NTP hydrolase)